ncbi:uncharacterized protein L203_105600 [Cryptococcus depauperatus CBS 7841]|uniref:Uncharacterized protein n=1 Tax=Cryptococcus depauperatus CBS 7841 TaxID=1295531 RepID=A0A1E3IGZ1_9TREE|nr:ATPase [Cryptococcus depauperatus CBS 7841]
MRRFPSPTARKRVQASGHSQKHPLALSLAPNLLIPTSTRSLQTTCICAFPRSLSSRRTFAGATNPELPRQAHSPPSPLPPVPSNLFSFATQILSSEKPSAPLPQDLVPIHTHLSTAFLPKNQHLSCDPPQSPFSHVISFPPGGQGRPQAEHVQREDEDSEQSQPEAAIALASPFEGGEFYIKDAVQKMANEMDADIVTLDLVLGLGLDGDASPLGSIVPPPSLPQSINPVYAPSTSPFSSPRKDLQPIQEEEWMDNHMPEQLRGGAFTSVPVAILGTSGIPVPAMGGPMGAAGPFLGQSDQVFATGQIDEEWVAFFSTIINVETSVSGKKRIVLLESPVAMNNTFPIWWASLVEAVRRRRRGNIIPGKRKSVTKAGTPDPALIHPTTIVLQCTPSPLPAHTIPFMSVPDKEVESLGEENDEADEHPHALFQALEEKLRSMGFNVQHKVEMIKPRADGKLWWGSEESDLIGRKEGDQSRLNAFLGKGLSASLPSFDDQADKLRYLRNPLQRLIGRLGSNRFDKAENNNTSPLIWKSYPIIPAYRNSAAEKESRSRCRRVYSAALMTRAVYQLGGELQNPLEVLNLSEETGKPLTRKTGASSFSKGWGNAIVSWSDALHIASIAVGKAAQNDKLEEEVAIITWQDVIQAKKAMMEEKKFMAEQISRHLPSLPEKDDQSQSAKQNDAQPVVDHVVERLKKDKKLTQHERRLLGCIVDPSKLASTTFDDVHLPEKTVDGIRSMISLPLLFPEAFRGGVLKDHATTGALLFGPPGTGKTLLARAVAAESGARMLAIQPSDVNDMYVGEGEKLVKAVFSLARRLSPCVVFLDEVDALFGARISRGSSGSMSHNLILTEFMQEMDGLSSAIANKDKRVVVISATNRPFDLDDAVLRRLPRRLLVDLPGVEERKAILKILLRGEHIGDDVNLDKIAQQTDGYSGSDLKHLCVSAALSAVKDTVNIPWKQTSHLPPSSIPFTSNTAPLHGDVSGGGQSEVLVIASDSNGSGGRKKIKTKKGRAPATAITSFFMLNPMTITEQSEQTMKEDEEVEAKGTSGEVTEEDQDEQLLCADKTQGENPIKNIPIVEAAPVDEEPVVPKRVLHAKHFKTALEEIRPSASEEGSLPELRKWAEQFGEGGKKRGKKSGFGKGFGFGDEAVKDSEQGYGRVQQDD